MRIVLPYNVYKSVLDAAGEVSGVFNTCSTNGDDISEFGSDVKGLEVLTYQFFPTLLRPAPATKEECDYLHEVAELLRLTPSIKPIADAIEKYKEFVH